MLETIAYLSPPFAICLLLVGILSYFGNHILERGIIFIDIALAQIAALGTIIGILIGLNPESITATLFSLAFIMMIVALFHFFKFEKDGIPEEAVIGTMYGLSLAVSIVLAERIPGGSNFIKETFTGNILWVTWSEVAVNLFFFLCIGYIHYACHNNFIAISRKQTENFTRSKLLLFDLLFFVTFGVVVVKAVSIGGIFVVFTFLIAPASIASLFSTDLKWRLLLSWVTGFLGSVCGIVLSYQFNLPNGPTIVCVLGFCLIVAGLIKKFAYKTV